MRFSDAFSVIRGVCVFAAPGALLGGLVGLISTIWLPWWTAAIPVILGGGISFRFFAKHCVVQ